VTRATSRAKQDALLDAIAAGWTTGKHRAPARPADAASLHPGVQLIHDCVAGLLTACAIRDSWAFHAEVTILDAAAFAEMARRGHVLFVPEGI